MDGYYIEKLKQIKKEILDENMSVLVGAGFSKNANPKFPDWTELIFDIVKELYLKEINYKYDILSSYNPSMNEDVFINSEIMEIIKKEGYLKLISDFMKRKGIGEAITVYIEEKIGPIDDSQCDLRLHEKLLDLNWNNVLTTNYDTLFEQVINSKLNGKEALYKKCQEELNNIEKEISKSDSENPRLNSEYERITLELKSAKEQYEELKKKEYEIVCSSNELALKSRRRLIKLHGTLRKEDSKYGFDGDIRKQYVISKEDYDSYPQKHEAFTQLMRIALLQECFCLIGFSGEDPNFIAWISWVRDILERDKNGRNIDKIYLLDVNNNQLDKDKELFLNNHRICRIPLLNPSVIEFLTNFQTETYNDDIKQVLSNFFDFLVDENIKLLREYEDLWNNLLVKGDTSKICINNYLDNFGELVRLERFNRLPTIPTIVYCKRFIGSFRHIYEKAINIKEKLILLATLALAVKGSFSTICLFDFYYSQWWEDIISEFRILDFYSLSDQEQLCWKIFKLMILKDYLFQNNEKAFDKWGNELPECLLNKDDILLLQYYKLQFTAINFRYDNLEEKLKHWSLGDNSGLHWTLKKAGLYSLLDYKESIKLLDTSNEKLTEEFISEKLIFYDIQSYFNFANNFQKDLRTDALIKEIKGKGYYDVTKYIENFSPDKRGEKLKPLGDDRYQFGRTISFGATKDQEDLFKSVQLINFMLEIGMPLKVKYVTLLSEEQWYLCFKNVFETYPKMALHFSFQYGENDLNEEFIRRVGQYYTNSEIGIDTLIEMFNDLKRLFDYYVKQNQELPKRKILYFITELFPVLPNNLWEPFFKDFWTNYNKQNRPLLYPDIDLKGYCHFIEKALNFLTDKKFLNEIIQDLLTYNGDKNRKQVDYLYNLCTSPLYIKNINYLKQNRKIKEKIIGLINIIPTEPGYILLLLANISELLTKVDKKLIKSGLESIQNFTHLIDYDHWRPLLYFSNGDKLFQQRIKDSLLKEKTLMLWDTGLRTNGGKTTRTFGGRFQIPFHKTRKKFCNWGLEWSNNEVLEIYSQLEATNELIKKHKNYFEVSNNDYDLFREMMWFLKDEKTSLKSVNTYSEIYEYVKEKYNENRGYSSIEDALISDDKTSVLLGIADLEKELEENSISKYLFEWELVLNKVLTQKEPKLEYCLEFLVYWLNKYKDDQITRNYLKYYLMIIKTYWLSVPPNTEKFFIEEQLIKMVLVLKYWGIENEYVENWVQRKQESRFIKIRNLT